MKNNDDIPTTDATESKQLINRVKRGDLDQGDAQLIKKLLNFLLTIVSHLKRRGRCGVGRAPSVRKRHAAQGGISRDA